MVPCIATLARVYTDVSNAVPGVFWKHLAQAVVGDRSFAVGRIQKRLFWKYFDQNWLLVRAQHVWRTRLVNFRKLDTLILPTLGLTCLFRHLAHFLTFILWAPRNRCFLQENKIVFRIHGARQCAPGVREYKSFETCCIEYLLTKKFISYLSKIKCLFLISSSIVFSFS